MLMLQLLCGSGRVSPSYSVHSLGVQLFVAGGYRSSFSRVYLELYFVFTALTVKREIIMKVELHSAERGRPPRPDSPLTFKSSCSKFHTLMDVKSITGLDLFSYYHQGP